MRYVAMGSSFGAGPGLRPRVAGSPLPAGRSAVNYAHLLAPRLGHDLVDVTYSGATVEQLLHGGPRDLPPQVDSVTGDTGLVTITAGGNDVGYLPALTFASFPAALRVALSSRDRVRRLMDPEGTRHRFAGLEADLDALLRRIRTTAPAARVLLVGYLTILPPEGIGTDRLPAQVAAWGRSTASRLRDLMERAAASTDAGFVDVPTLSADHHAWSVDPWTRRFHLTLRGGAAYHPNTAGMRAVAAAVEQRLVP